MFRSLIIIGAAAAGGVVISGMLSSNLEEAKFAKEWKPETKKAVSFGITAASGALLFSLLRGFVK